jgi:hypothetical protein
MGVTDRIPEQIAAMVYVDSGPAKGAINPDPRAAEVPLPSREELAEQESLQGLTEEQLEMFWRRAVPEPGAALREGPELTNDARPVRAEHRCLHLVHLRADQGRGRAGPWVGSGPGRAARGDLPRPADQPPADVVAPAGARCGHWFPRGRRIGVLTDRPPPERSVVRLDPGPLARHRGQGTHGEAVTWAGWTVPWSQPPAGGANG